VSRAHVDRAKLERFMVELGRRVRGPGRVYLTGGATALWVGWRETTVDVDLKLDPEPPGAFEAIAALKEDLDLNVELASPDQFLPAVPGWRERSVHVGRYGPVDFFHFDYVSQALAKLARAHDRDTADVEAMLRRGLVSVAALLEAFERIAPELVRFPGVDARALEQRVTAFAERFRG
jgi:hypothetical protein